MRFKKTPSGHKIMLVANPTSGQMRLKKKWDKEIHPFLLQHLKNFDFSFTKGPGDATKITIQALKDGYDLIVSMGGDGTLNEVVNGFFLNKKQINPNAVLGILPFGSGGDFIRTLHFSKDYQKAIIHLKTKKTKKIDLGIVEFKDPTHTPRYFINIAEIGLGAAIMKRVNVKSKKYPALLKYLTGSVQGFLDHKNIKVRLRLIPQGSHIINLTNLVIANGQYFGRGMRPAPQAKLDDGVFDVIVIKDMNFLRFLINFPQMYTQKKFVSSKVLDIYQSNHIKIESLETPNRLSTELDGETYGSGNQSFKVLPKALNLKV